MHIDILTLFPDVFGPFLSHSIIGRAIEAGLVSVDCVDFRDFAHDRHRTVDDRPFGGGPGMVMKCEPVFEAIEAVEARRSGRAARILLTPQGERLTQSLVADLSAEPWLVVLCGHYEGFDERIRVGLEPREISIGDFVLSGGEPAAMALVDAVVRLIPGALGDEASAVNDSFTDGLLEYPQYTRPRDFRGMEVPEVLISGDHGKVTQWRLDQSLQRTRERRPDLMKQYERDRQRNTRDEGPGEAGRSES